jgi:transcriptional regulator with XRE-family HTH domain
MHSEQRPAASVLLRLSRNDQEVADTVREILHSKGLTLYRLAALTRTRYPHQAAYHIRRNFYFQLRSGLSPAFQQVVALAAVTDLPLSDWLKVFGFSLSDIPRLQSVMSRRQTGLIDKNSTGRQILLPRLRYRRRALETFATIAPLRQLLEPSGSETASSLLAPGRRDFVYAKIGSDDALAFPELAPGSIVRADPRLVRSVLPRAPSELSRHFFLCETSRGFCCARLRSVGANRFALAIPDPQYPAVEFQRNKPSRILGVVDLELRFGRTLGRSSRPRAGSSAMGTALTEPWRPGQAHLADGTVRASFDASAFLKRARLRAGLSFRVASDESREIAKALGDSRYFTSAGTLSDYEAGDKLPRHIHKLFTVSILYAVGFEDLLRSFGIDVETNVQDMQTIPRTRGRHGTEVQPATFLESLVDQFGDLPLFLANALPSLTGLAHLSLRDVFRVGNEVQALHPSVRGALFVLVNRRSKNPRFFPRIPLEEQPLYLLQERNGLYFLASCAIEGGRLVVRADSQATSKLQLVPRYADAEVTGQVVAIARTVLPTI